MRLLPIDVCSYVGCILGRILGPLHRQADRQLRTNLKKLRQDIQSPQQVKERVTRSWGNYGRVMAEFSVLRRIWKSPTRTIIMGLDHFDKAKSLKQPVIVIFVHLGNWEIIGPKLYDFVDGRAMQIYQILDDPVQARISSQIRQPYIDSLLAAGPYVAKKIYNRLMQGEYLSLAVDECVNNEVRAPSFGRPLRSKNNLTLAVRFAKLTNAVLCPVYAVRDNGARFVINILPSIKFDFDKVQIPAAVMQLDALIESIIRKHIDQWYYNVSLNLHNGSDVKY